MGLSGLLRLIWQVCGQFIYMEDEEGPKFKAMVSLAFGVIGVCLIGSSFFVAGDEAHKLFTDIIQLIMLVSGSVSIIVAVVMFFIRTTPDIWM